MYNNGKDLSKAAARCVALWITQEEADALLSVLLEAAPSPAASGDVVDRLLCRVAEVQRTLYQAGALTRFSDWSEKALDCAE